MGYKVKKDVMGVSVEIFNVSTKYDTSYFCSIEHQDAVYVGKTVSEAELNTEKLVVEYLVNKQPT